MEESCFDRIKRTVNGLAIHNKPKSNYEWDRTMVPRAIRQQEMAGKIKRRRSLPASLCENSARPNLHTTLVNQKILEEPNEYFSDSETHRYSSLDRFTTGKRRPTANFMTSSSVQVAQATQYKIAAKQPPKAEFRSPNTQMSCHPAPYYSAQPASQLSNSSYSLVDVPADYQKMNYAQLVQLADQQRANIEKNSALIQQKELRLKMMQQNQRTPQAHAAVQARLQTIRQEVKGEESQLARLRQAQGQAEAQKEQNLEAKGELEKLQEMFSHKERELREAVNKVETLRSQLETLQSQRRSATSAAVAMAARASRDQKLANQRAAFTSRQAELRGNLREQQTVQPATERPKATIEPFKVIPPSKPSLEQSSSKKIETTTVFNSSTTVNNNYLTSKGFAEAFSAVQETLKQQETCKPPPIPPLPSGEQPQKPDSLKISNSYNSANLSAPEKQDKISPQNASLPVIRPKFDRYISPFRPNGESPPLTRSPQIPRVTVRQAQIPAVSTNTSGHNSSQESAVSNSNSPSPSRQFANSNYIHSAYTRQGASGSRASPQGSDQGSVSSSDSEHATGARNAPKVSMSISRRLRMTQGMEEMFNEPPPPDLIPQNEKRNFASAAGPTTKIHFNPEDTVDAFYSHVESDKIHIRSDNLRAAKRRSWAQDATNDEAEHIRRVLRREQMRGRSHINLSWIFGQVTPQPPSEQVEAKPEAAAAQVVLAEPTEPPQLHLDPLPEPELEIRPPPPYEWHIRQQSRQKEQQQLALLDLQGQHKQVESGDGSSSGSDTESQRKITVIDVDPEIQLPPPPAKGILKVGVREKEKRNIIFDPLALLLDAALEGELELVKTSAQRMTDVSISNDEGITALHNAICAGHYEIVRFLVEANADVNAQDSDGWTPLHCAASCNNLPMVKFLVERGACVFATTVSDHETPADKCEEDEDGFDGCSQFLINIQEKIGYMNDCRVFAAFTYDESDREDEIIFQEGEELTVLNRAADNPEKGWWWCRHEGSKVEGYVPRNYLALYPRLAAQKAMQAFQNGVDKLDDLKLEEESDILGDKEGDKTEKSEKNTAEKMEIEVKEEIREE